MVGAPDGCDCTKFVLAAAKVIAPHRYVFAASAALSDGRCARLDCRQEPDSIVHLLTPRPRLHPFVPGERNAAVCGGTDCGRPEDSSVHAVVAVGGGQTVSQGPAEGDVCIGPLGDGHRPAVRTTDGRCFICEPLTVYGTADMAEELDDIRTYCDECGCWDGYHQRENGCTECDHCRVGKTALPPISPSPLPPYAVEYTVNGGQTYSLIVPGDASVTVEDGQLHIYHPGRPALGITAISTTPRLTFGEDQPHDAEAEDRHT